MQINNAMQNQITLANADLNTKSDRTVLSYAIGATFHGKHVKCGAYTYTFILRLNNTRYAIPIKTKNKQPASWCLKVSFVHLFCGKASKEFRLLQADTILLQLMLNTFRAVSNVSIPLSYRFRIDSGLPDVPEAQCELLIVQPNERRASRAAPVTTISNDLLEGGRSEVTRE